MKLGLHSIWVGTLWLVSSEFLGALGYEWGQLRALIFGFIFLGMGLLIYIRPRKYLSDEYERQ